MFNQCIVFRQLVKKWSAVALASFVVFNCSAFDDSSANIIELKALNPYFKSVTRTPGSYVPRDEVQPVPIQTKIWLEKVFVEDNSGVMRGVRNSFQAWDDTDEYAKNWNLKSTGLYETPSIEQRKEHLNRNLLRYVDKRLAGEIKNADEGSALHQVGQVQQALRPSATAEFSPKIKVKFKARVLQGKAYMLVENPWVEHKTEVSAKGEVQMKFKRDIKQLGVETHLEYQVTGGTYVAWMDKPLTDTLKARLSSSQSDKDIAFTDNTDRTLQFIYSKPF